MKLVWVPYPPFLITVPDGWTGGFTISENEEE